MLRFGRADPLFLVMYGAVILLAITLHEYAHAWTADRLGDPTARREGRLSLNPLAHLDPVGAVMLALFGFGWARPVPINPWYFRDSRRGTLLVAMAGPLANVTLAWVANLLLGMLDRSLFPVGWGALVFTFLRTTVVLNLWLAAFNLIPIPPLDGSRILAGLVSHSQAVALARLEAYGPLLLVLLIVSGASGMLLRPIFDVLRLLIGGFS